MYTSALYGCGIGIYSITAVKGLMGGLLHLVQRGGDWAALPAVPNITSHPSTASVAIIVLLYNDPLLYGFDLPIKGQ